jgi:RNase H-like domain found in reverse transcriptase
MWEPDWPTCLKVDALGYVTGGVLLQQLEDSLWHPIAFRSELMVPIGWNYEIYNKEMLDIVQTLEDWRHYLEGLPHLFTIITVHWNLEYWQTTQNLSCRQARWSLYLSQFDFQISHKPRTPNI